MPMIPMSCRSDLIGRRSQLALLVDRLSDASAGKGRTVLITGEAGIGKSRLITELERSVDPNDRWFSVGYCRAYISTPFLPFTVILRDLFGLHEEKSNALSACLKGLLLRTTLAQTSTVLHESEQYKQRQFEEIVRSLHRIAQIRPLVIVVEDVHWADNATVELLRFLITRLCEHRILLIVTCRTGLLCDSTSQAFLEDLQRLGADRMHLPPLSRAEIRNLVQSMLADHEPVAASLIHQIEELAGGNPLYAEELLKSAMLQLGTKSSSVRIPVSLSENVAERLRRLSPEPRAIVLQASAIGRNFDAGLLMSITRAPWERVLDALQQAQDLHLIIEQSSHPASYAFCHELVRQSIYRQLSASETLRVHERIALFFEGAVDGPNRLDELAYHWAAAGNKEKAIRFNVLAAEAATTIHAFGDVARYYQRALHFLEQGDSNRPVLCEKLAAALYVSGYISEARHWIDEAIEGYQMAADEDAITRILLQFAKLEFFNANTEASAMLVDRALRNLSAKEREHDECALEAYTEMARYLNILGRSQDACAYIELAAQIVKRCGLELPAHLYDVRAITWANLGRTARALSNFRMSTNLAGSSGDIESDLRAWSNLGCSATWLGEDQLAINAYERAIELCEQHGFAVRSTFSALGLARTLILFGDLQRAHSLLQLSLDRGISAPLNQLAFAEICIPLFLMLGDEASLTHMSDEEHLLALAARAGSCWLGRITSVLVELALYRGRAEKARMLLHDAVRSILAAEESWWMLVLVAAHGYSSDLPRARALLARSTTRRTKAGIAFGHFFEAHCAARNHRDSDCKVHAAASAAVFKDLRWPIFQARALELSRCDREALTIYKKVGSIIDVQRLAHTSKSRLDVALTPRQVQIAELVAQGLSNRSIAKALGISEHTVGHHMESIFNRLDICSRVQLASFAKPAK